MSDDLDLAAASYALGLLRGDARAALEAEAERDAVLRARVDLWQTRLAGLDLAARPLDPDRDLFPDLLAALDRAADELPGTSTLRAGSGTWTELAPGVMLKVLFEDPVAKRRAVLIRAAPGSILAAHQHQNGPEECLVLEGDLVLGDLILHAGDFHVAQAGSIHPATTTRTGCLIHVSSVPRP